MPPPHLLSPEHVALIDGGISAIAAACGHDQRPSVMRAVGTHITPDGRRITVWLAASQSAELLRQVAETGRLAVVFSQPASHRTVQVKTRRVQQRPATADDLPVLLRYRAAMEQEVALVGFPPLFTQAMLAFDLADLVALSFEPEAAFDQTPGPKAGAALAAGAAP